MDLYLYVNNYLTLTNIDFFNITEFFTKDITFWYFSKLISMIFMGNYTIWLFILGAIYIISIYKLIRNYSQTPLISLVIFFALGFYTFGLTGLRQTLAMSFITLSFNYLLNRKFLYFLFIVLCASLFHKTALIFIIAYPITKLSLSKKTIIVYMVTLAMLQVIGTPILRYIVSLQIDERFNTYLENPAVLNATLLFQLLLIFFFSYFSLKTYRKNYLYQILFHLSLLSIIFQSLSYSIAEMFRIAMYFSLFNIILFANAIFHISKYNNYKYVKPMILLALACYFSFIQVSGTSWKYFFFWETPTLNF